MGEEGCWAEAAAAAGVSFLVVEGVFLGAAAGFLGVVVSLAVVVFLGAVVFLVFLAAVAGFLGAAVFLGGAVGFFVTGAFFGVFFAAVFFVGAMLRCDKRHRLMNCELLVLQKWGESRGRASTRAQAERLMY
jgi:hypothetical protein